MTHSEKPPAEGRFLGFEAIVNFRDFGGYTTPRGRLRSGLLFRSAAHDAATQADLALLDTLCLRIVVDLRGPTERAAAPSLRPANFTADIIEDDHPQGHPAPHVMISGIDPGAEAVRQQVIAYYQSAPFNSSHQALFRRFFERVSHQSGPILIHCAAGKDRTGMLVALLQHALGVSYDDLLEEYLLTNRAGLDQHLAAAADRFARAGGVDALTVASRQAMLSADPDYLAGAWQAIIARCGSIDAYLEHFAFNLRHSPSV